MKKHNYLVHHGVLGMKWGIRRYQNPDGSLTAEGKKRYYNDDGTYTKEGAELDKKYREEAAVANTTAFNVMSEFISEEILDKLDDDDKMTTEVIEEIIDFAMNAQKEYTLDQVGEHPLKMGSEYIDELLKNDKYTYEFILNQWKYEG